MKRLYTTYKKYLKTEMDTLFSAFVQANRIFNPEATEVCDLTHLTPEEAEEIQKMFAHADAITPVCVNKEIGGAV